MSAQFEQPYVLAPLPRPLAGRILCRPVFGLTRRHDTPPRHRHQHEHESQPQHQQHQQQPRLRQRSEIVAAIDGDSISIYDIPTARAVTCYPIPPNEWFLCPVYSLRVRGPDKTVSRYTFAVTSGHHHNHNPPQAASAAATATTSTSRVATKLTLFRHVVHPDGKTASTVVHRNLPRGPRIVHIDLCGLEAWSGLPPSLLAVTVTGDVICYDGESLAQVWREPSGNLVSDSGSAAGARSAGSYDIVFAATTTAPTPPAGSSINADRWLAALLRDGSSSAITTTTTGEDAVLLVLVSVAVQDGQTRRFVSVLKIDSSPLAATSGQRLTPLQIAPLPPHTSDRGPEKKDGHEKKMKKKNNQEDESWNEADRSATNQKDFSWHDADRSATYRISFHHGQLLELRAGELSIYALSATSAPRLARRQSLPNGQSFYPLSAHSIFSCEPDHISIHNHTYGWTQTRVALPLPEGLPALETGRATAAAASAGGPWPCALVGYWPTLDHVAVLAGTSLVAVPFRLAGSDRAGRRAGNNKRHLDGRLIDAMANPAPRSFLLPREAWSLSRPAGVAAPSSDPPSEITEDMARADDLIRQGHASELDSLMALKFCLDMSSPDVKKAYPRDMDPLWALYAISRAFSASAESGSTAATTTAAESERTGPARSSIQLSPPLSATSVLQCLVLSGSLTLHNLRIGLQPHLTGTEDDSDLAADLVRILVQADPSLELLAAYVSCTTLDALELVITIRAMMESLGLLQPPCHPLGLDLHSPSPDSDSGPDPGAAEAATEPADEMELDRLEEELAVTEHHLGEYSDSAASQPRGLDVALAKLASCPAAATVQALRTILQTDGVLDLVRVLRVELVGGAWTTRYVDSCPLEQQGQDGGEPPPDGIIALIATLLGRCLDAVGLGAWHLDDDDLVESLQLEIKAALEGIQEAIYLCGTVAEAIQRGGLDQQQQQQQKQSSTRRAIQPMQSAESQLLPLGPPQHLAVGPTKIVAGGEVISRTNRETGYLRSQKVGAYSLEKLAV